MQEPRRARQLGIVVGRTPTGPRNAITDVPGVTVGHSTIVQGESIRTGVTAVVPEQLATRPSLPAGLAIGNGYGKLVGATQVVELGCIETPVVLTATLSTFRAADALVTYMLGQLGRERMISVNPVVGETNDGFLSDIRARPVTEAHVLAALRGATAEPPDEGCVGAGTGTSALGFKAGIGTSSRLAETSAGTATVGVLVQANFSGVLRVRGEEITPEEMGVPDSTVTPEQQGNSCVFIIATDARLDARQLTRAARRAIFAMGSVGSDFAAGSGDYALAFSTAETGCATLPEADLDALFVAVREAAEESILNSLFMARTTVGWQGRVRYAVPHDRLLTRLTARGVIKG